MNVLILNAGSSSIKFQNINPNTGEIKVKGNVDGIGLDTCKANVDGKTEKKKINNHHQAISWILENIDTDKIDAIGHRVVHGGEFYKESIKVNERVINKIQELCELAPLHNPNNLAGIIACKKLLPKVPQVAVFDTAFHQTMDKENYMYGIPYSYYKKYKIRKYGFHGTSHKYVAEKAAKILGKKKPNLITCHLGNGSSICCIRKGISIDTSMGFTPLQGLIMGTRSGDIDPEIVNYIEEKEKINTKEVLKILNKKSGFKGISGYSDMRTIHDKASKGDKRCQLAIDMFCSRISSYIGSYIVKLENLDAIIFTAGIGQYADYIRKKVCKDLENVGIKIDLRKNRPNNFIDITAKSSKSKIFVIPTNEEWMIAKETIKVLKRKKERK